jgi:hypothetical protein
MEFLIICTVMLNLTNYERNTSFSMSESAQFNVTAPDQMRPWFESNLDYLKGKDICDPTKSGGNQCHFTFTCQRPDYEKKAFIAA